MYYSGTNYNQTYYDTNATSDTFDEVLTGEKKQYSTVINTNDKNFISENEILKKTIKVLENKVNCLKLNHGSFFKDNKSIHLKLEDKIEEQEEIIEEKIMIIEDLYYRLDEKVEEINNLKQTIKNLEQSKNSYFKSMNYLLEEVDKFKNTIKKLEYNEKLCGK
jgi:chromosome segregation ATPase